MRNSLLILAWLVAVMVTAAEKGAITPAAMASWKIVCDTAGTESERYAATEFQRLFKEMTGTVLPVVDTSPTDTRRLNRARRSLRVWQVVR